MPTYGETPSTLHTPHHATATDGSASAASEIEVGSIYATTQELRAAAAKQAGACDARMAWCAVWRVEGSPCTSAFVKGA